MKLTPAIKGQLTKAVKAAIETMYFVPQDSNRTSQSFRDERIHKDVYTIFAKHMPAEQAKHATRKYLAH